MRQYSIIIPVIGDHLEFEKTLGSVLRYLPEQAQVIVPCGKTYDDPCSISGEVRLVRHDSLVSPGMVDCWREAAAVANGDLVALFLPGIELSSEWDSLVSAAFDDSEVAVVAPRLSVAADMAKSGKRPAGIKNETCGIQLDAGYSSRIVTQNRRNKTVSIDGPTLMAGVFRNEALGWLDLDAIGLCDASLDSELSAGLKALGYQAACETDWKVDLSGSPDDYCFDRTVPGVVAERIVRRYSSKGKSGLLRRIFVDFLRGQAGVGLSRLMAGSHGESDNRFAEKLVRSIQERDRILQAAAGNFGTQRNSPRESGRVLKRAA